MDLDRFGRLVMFGEIKKFLVRKKLAKIVCSGRYWHHQNFIQKLNLDSLREFGNFGGSNHSCRAMWRL